MDVDCRGGSVILAIWWFLGMFWWERTDLYDVWGENGKRGCC